MYHHGSSLILLPDVCELPAKRQRKRKAPVPVFEPAPPPPHPVPVSSKVSAAILSVYKTSDRVPVEAALDGSAEALRVQRTIAAASGGGVNESG